ncbi:MAG: M6 family metalloprotease domain-containing protein [Bacteroidales bacterium]|nr:M6 family metalloprotease domain-containing protein [Bacteroidales bacterium]
MKKKFILSIFFFAFSLITYASYLENFPITVTQPDGEIVHCFTTGDEFYNRVHDANGFTLIRCSQTGVVVYAKLENDELVSTGYRVGTIDPASIGLTPGIIISAEKREQLRSDFLSTMSSSKSKEGVLQRGGGEEEPEIMRVGQNNGTINNLVVYIRFSDQTEFSAKGTTYRNMFNLEQTNTASMYSYFKTVSHEKTLINTTFYPVATGSTIVSYQDIYPRNYYEPWNATTNPNGWQGSNNGDERRLREHQLLQRAIAHIHDQVPATLNLDFNCDGRVDNVCFIIRGATTAWATLLWPHRWALYSYNVQLHGKQVYDYNFQIETSLDGSGVGVLTHEMFHTLGSPDFYRYTNTTITPAGYWEVMASDGNPPQSSTAYVKWKYGGWIDGIPEIKQNGTYTLNNVLSPTNYAYKIASPNSATEYFVIEYRDNTLYYDSRAPGRGIIIYRINPALNGNADGPPDELYVFRPGGSNNTVNGTINSAHFSSNTGRTTFNDTSNPPCFLANNTPGGIHIRNIGLVGTTMSFEVVMTKHILEVSAGQGGTISESGRFVVDVNGNKTFTFSANVGRVIDAVLVDGVNVPAAVTAGSYTFTNVNKNQTLQIVFACAPQNLPITESFDNTTFPPNCWNNESATTSPWNRVTLGTFPTVSTHSGAGMLRYNSYSYPSDRTGLLITPKLATNNNNSKLTFWMYRDNGFPCKTDKVNIYLSSNHSITGLIPVLTIHRSRELAPVITTANGWYEYTVNLPTSSMSNAYVIFEGVSNYGNNIFVDDIKIEAIVATTYTIGGTVSGLTNNVGVAVNYTVNGGAQQSVNTAAGGAYTITNIPHNANVVITASAQAGYTSSVSATPSTAAVTSNITGKNIVYILILNTCIGQVFDVVNNITYNVVELSGRCWLKENLRNTKYQDNSIIPFAKPYYHLQYPDSTQYKIDFGLLYDYQSVFPEPLRAGTREICPDGWRIPTVEEWKLLEVYDAKDLKNPFFWLQPNNNTNNSEFDSRSAGWFNFTTQRFEYLYGYTAYWSSNATANTCTCAILNYNCNIIELVEIQKNNAISVRCIKE